MVMAKGVPIKSNGQLINTPRHYTVMAEEVPNSLIGNLPLAITLFKAEVVPIFAL